MELDDPIAIHSFGCDYKDGTCGYPQDHSKALELYHRSGELGFAGAYNSIGYAYNNGEGVKVDKEKATYYYELSAIGGCVQARYNLGRSELQRVNVDRAVKHFMIAVRGGHDGALEQIKLMYSNGYATKENYTKALQSYQEYLVEIKSPRRDKVAVTGPIFIEQ